MVPDNNEKSFFLILWTPVALIKQVVITNRTLNLGSNRMFVDKVQVLFVIVYNRGWEF